jgi:hypothetical protein
MSPLQIHAGATQTHSTSGTAFLNIQQPDDWNAQETRMYAHKLPAVAAFLQANWTSSKSCWLRRRIILGSSAQAKLVIVASGVSAWEVVEVLQSWGSTRRARAS